MVEKKKNSSAAIALAILILLIGSFAFAVLLAYPFMLAWNYAMVAAFSVAKPIEFGQAFVLMMLFCFLKGNSSVNKNA